MAEAAKERQQWALYALYDRACYPHASISLDQQAYQIWSAYFIRSMRYTWSLLFQN